MKSIPLEKLHTELGAKFGPFAGYNMPIQYPMGLKGEHHHTRTHAGLFDVSHMGQLRITSPKDPTGAQLRKELEAALPCDFDGWPNDTQRYSLLLNSQGGIEDDLMLVWRDMDCHAADAARSDDLRHSVTVDRHGLNGPRDDDADSTTKNRLCEAAGRDDDADSTPKIRHCEAAGRSNPEVRMVVNAGNRDADLALLQKLAPNLKFEWIDAALIALQGPDAESVLAKLDPKAADMVFMQARDLTLCGVTCFTTRTGYTGEDGYEISIPAADADRIVREMLKDDRVKPIGLGARDTLRLEAGLPLHGNDISPTITPIEAGLPFSIAASRRLPKTNADGSRTNPAKTGGFPGADTVLKHLSEGARRKLVGMISKEPVPIRSHAKIINANGQEVGEVTSGTVSPSLGYPVMLALIQSDAVSQPLSAIVRNKQLKVEITKLPFVPKRYKR